MAHFGKYTKGSLGGLTKHYERAKDKDGNYVRFKNEGIDLSRSHLNYNLAPHQKDQRAFIKERLEEVFCLNRENVKVMCDWVVTVPKTVPEGRQREFFERAYQFLEDKYGKENVISAYVHMDETTPHMHFAFIPVVYDKKKDREKVSAKEAVTREDLREFHGELQEVMSRFVERYDFEFECDVLNGATDNGNLTVQGLKAKELEVIVESFIEQSNVEAEKLQDTVRERESLEKSLEVLKADKYALTREIADLEGKLDGLKADRGNALNEFFKHFPHVKEAFDKFCDLWQRKIERERNEAREKRMEKIAPERNKGVMSMDEWEKVIRERRSSSPVPERKPNIRINRDEHER